jgi:hypothetical protein
VEPILLRDHIQVPRNLDLITQLYFARRLELITKQKIPRIKLISITTFILADAIPCT